MEVSKKKNTEMIQRSATGRDAMETSKQEDLSTLPERKITRKPPAAASDIPLARGRKTGEFRALSVQQSQRVFSTMCNERPDRDNLQFGNPLWNISAVCRLVQQDCGLSLARTTVARYLERWGISPEHPFEVGMGMRLPIFTRWAFSAYPKIQARALAEQADIFWFFEDDIYPEEISHSENPSVLPRSSSGSHRLLSVIQGQLRESENRPLNLLTHWENLSWIEMPKPIPQNTSSSWLILSDPDPTDRIQKFLNAMVRLSEACGRKVFLIVPDDQLSSTAKISTWLASVSAHIEVFALPPYQAAPN